MKIQQLPQFVRTSSTPPGGRQNPIGDAIDKLTLSPLQIGLDLLDGSMGLGYTTASFPEMFQVAGYTVGAAHGALAAGYLMGCVEQTRDVAHSRVGKAFGHALLATGHVAGAAGAGVWALAPLIGGMVVTTLQDYRDRN